METLNQFETKWHQTLTAKVLLIGALGLLLLIPLSMVKSVIRERQSTEAEVERELFDKWGGEQIITAPILHIPTYRYVETEQEGKTKRYIYWLHVMPEKLNIDGVVTPEIRYRGIYKKVLYTSTLKFSGYFNINDQLNVKFDEIDWDDAYLTIGISDNRGIKGEVELKWNDQLLKPEAGLITSDLNSNGISIKTPALLTATKYNFEVPLTLSGAKGLAFNPIGKITNVNIQSPWDNPSFYGAFSPINPQIDNEGFEAQWTVTHLNRNFPQYWLGKSHRIDEHQLGVNLYDPVNHYQKSLRSAKYGILIISLTLLVFLFIELVKKKKIQFIQYLLVGLALVLFYSVLTALSEHIGFSWAYLVASSVIIMLITAYSYGMIKDKQQALWIFILLTVLYAFLFVLLQLNDFAFLAGNIGLLVALGAIMNASLKIKKQMTSK